MKEISRVADRSPEAAPAPPTAPPPGGDRATVTVPIGVSLAEADRRLILATLEHCGGVKKRAAELLGVSLKTLYNRLEGYRSQAPDAPPQAPERGAPLRVARR